MTEQLRLVRAKLCLAILMLPALSLLAQQGPDGAVRDPSISDDGRLVTFVTNATQLFGGGPMCLPTTSASWTPNARALQRAGAAVP